MRRVTSEGASQHEGFDTGWKFVRVVERRPDGFVEFQFAIGDPDVFVEMIMSPEAFAEFCEANEVTMLAPTGDPEAEQSDWDWSLHDAVHRRFKEQ